jgi:hypothetical protein
VNAGRRRRLRGDGYVYEGARYREYWTFEGGLLGELVVEYAPGDGCGKRWVGQLCEASTQELPEPE